MTLAAILVDTPGAVTIKWCLAATTGLSVGFLAYALTKKRRPRPWAARLGFGIIVFACFANCIFFQSTAYPHRSHDPMREFIGNAIILSPAIPAALALILSRRKHT